MEGAAGRVLDEIFESGRKHGDSQSPLQYRIIYICVYWKKKKNIDHPICSTDFRGMEKIISGRSMGWRGSWRWWCRPMIYFLLIPVPIEQRNSMKYMQRSFSSSTNKSLPRIWEISFFFIIFFFLSWRSLTIDSNEPNNQPNDNNAYDYFTFLIFRFYFSIVFWLFWFWFDRGNLPSSMGNQTDRLVQLCHGATGFVFCLCTAASFFKHRQNLFLKHAAIAGKCIFERGLLLKVLKMKMTKKTWLK